MVISDFIARYLLSEKERMFLHNHTAQQNVFLVKCICSVLM